MAEREENHVTALAAQMAPAPVARVPLLDGDVHDLDGVQTVADHLFGLSDSSHCFVNPGIPAPRRRAADLNSSRIPRPIDSPRVPPKVGS